MEREKSEMNICILSQDIPFSNPNVNLADIFAKGGLKPFISSRFSENIPTSSAIKIFNHGKLKGLTSGIEFLRESGEYVDLFFLTPFGLLHSQQILVEYQPCTRNLPEDRLEYFLSESNMETHIQKTLEDRSQLLIVYMSHRLWKSLNFLDYIPADTPTIFISDVTPNTDGRNSIILSETLLRQRKVNRFGVFLKNLSKELLSGALKYEDNENKREEGILFENLEKAVHSVLRGKEKKNKDLLKIINRV